MSAFVDTSFLFAFYFPRNGSAEAEQKMSSLAVSPVISALVRYEFNQAVSFGVWLKSKGQANGIVETSARSVLAAFEADLDAEVWALVSPDWERVIARAERLALDRTPRLGARAMDLLHLATALEIGATELLSFDVNQRRTAEAEGLLVS